MKSPKRVAALVVAGLLAGCGGGGGGGAPVPPDPPATFAGLYAGSASAGRTFDALILDNGRFYAMLGTSAGGITDVYIGTSTATATTFDSVSAKDLDIASGALRATTLTSTGSPKVSIGGLLSGTITFNATYDARFEAKPSLASIAGIYQGDARSPEGLGAINLTVSSTGVVTGSTLGCSLAGTVAPRADANVYDLSINFGAGCKNSSRATFAGHAVLGTIANVPPGTRMTAIATDPDFMQALFIVAAKP